MSFDELDWDEVDPGDEDDEPEDWDDNWHWYDGPPRPPKEEPDCYVCNDNGGRCCEPTRLDILRWRLASWWRDLPYKLRLRRTPTGPDEPPF